MKTYIPKKEDIKPKWFLVDAKGVTLGRLATKVATILRGKHEPNFTPHMVTGDYVIVVNADKIELTGGKEEKKKYYWHSGFLGGIKEATFNEKIEKDPTFPVVNAIKGMIPRNKLKNEIMTHLKVYAGAEHNHSAQQPVKLEIK